MGNRNDVYAAAGFMAVLAVVIAVLGILAAAYVLGSSVVDALTQLRLVAVR